MNKINIILVFMLYSFSLICIYYRLQNDLLFKIKFKRSNNILNFIIFYIIHYYLYIFTYKDYLNKNIFTIIILVFGIYCSLFIFIFAISYLYLRNHLPNNNQYKFRVLKGPIYLI